MCQHPTRAGLIATQHGFLFAPKHLETFHLNLLALLKLAATRLRLGKAHIRQTALAFCKGKDERQG
jgi:hypothetical protein